MGWYTLQYKMLLFCVKPIVKDSRNFELVCLNKKKKERKHFGRLATFWFGTFSTTRCVVGHEALKNEWYVVIKAYKFTVFEILRGFFVLSYITCPCCPNI